MTGRDTDRIRKQQEEQQPKESKTGLTDGDSRKEDAVAGRDGAAMTAAGSGTADGGVVAGIEAQYASAARHARRTAGRAPQNEDGERDVDRRTPVAQDDSSRSSVREDSRRPSERDVSSRSSVLAGRAAVLQQAPSPVATDASAPLSEGWQERRSRNELRRVDDLGVPKPDAQQVEYRRVRLERVLLVGIWNSQETTYARARDSLRELAALATTAGASVLDGFLQQRAVPDPATYLGSGKAKQLARLVDEEEADTIIVNTELPPSQRRALENVTGVHVIDRTAVILDIFAQHARSREGKAQVELAQLQYMLPRLRGWGEALSRQAGGQAAGQAGGIGSRGPGETRLEMNRRLIHRRIAKLRHDLAAMQPTRATKRDSRRRNGVPTVAVVGYTNAGKSSLINALTHSHELVGNALFATLDTAVRGSVTSTGRLFAYTDTVGFVSDLPTQLVEAFKSTLEEIADAQAIVHVVDASTVDPSEQIEAVERVLTTIDGVSALPRVLVLNKQDLLTDTARSRLERLYPGALFVSARTGEGIDSLRTAVEQALPVPPVHISTTVPFSQTGLVEQVRTRGILRSLEWTETGARIGAEVDDALAARLQAVSV